MIARFRAAAPEHPAAEYENTFVNRRGETTRRLLALGPASRRARADARDHRRRHRHHRAPRGGGAREREREFLEHDRERGAEPPLLIDENGVVEPRRRPTRPSSARSRSSRDETAGTVFWEHYVAPEEAAMVREPDRPCGGGRGRRRPRQHLGDEERAAHLGLVVVPSSCPPSTSAGSCSSAAAT